MARLSFGYRSKLTFIIVGSIIGIASLIYTNNIARTIKEKEKYEIELWSRSWALYNRFDPRSQIENEITSQILSNTTSIPAIMADDFLRIVGSQYIENEEELKKSPEKLRKVIEKMCSADRPPIRFINPEGIALTVYYDDSALLKSIYFFPYIQLGLISVFFGFAFISFRSSKQYEQNRVWVGMAKETAHQLGTPTSSLLGWIDYIKSMEMMPEVTEEMSKDITRLMKVADRFGKIGSSTQLSERNVYDVVAGTVDYFRSRIPKNVELRIEQCVPERLDAMVNESLFEWVIENLLKNALDALQGKGEIDVRIALKDKWVVVDVRDTGKGMPKSNFKKIFQPGFTTKTRGWGLGLSLSRRIVEEYHFGKIFVRESEVGKGTTFRILLKRVVSG